MKAFVIKNKEGKYFVNRYVQAKKIWNAFIFEDKNDAEQVKGKDDEVVEITITEGDLEEENRVLKVAFENCYSKFQYIAKENGYKTIPSEEHFINQAKGEKDE